MISNICHFVFGLQEQTDEFLFIYYVAVYSAYIINNPDLIYFYYHYEPYGLWWNKLKLIPNIKLVIVDIPTHFGNKVLKKTAHKADWIRMQILYNKGGVYLDIDTICVKPWKHLLNNDVVLGREVPNGICNAIMFCKPKTEFFKLWLDNYENYFNTDGWREASIELPEKLSKRFPHLLTLKDPDVFFLPNYNETQKIFSEKRDIPQNIITLHLWETLSIKYIKHIDNWKWAYKNSHTMYGKMLLNLNNYVKDSNSYFALKQHFKKECNDLICIHNTYLKKSLEHSNDLDENMKIKLKIGDEVSIIGDFNNSYFLVSYTTTFCQKNKNEVSLLTNQMISSKMKTLHIIHRIDKTNIGDMVSNCSEYYSFKFLDIVKHDIYSPQFEKIQKNDTIILSGGGLLNCLEIWNKNINELLSLSENVIGWGIGFNTHYNTTIKTKINLKKFKLLGLRDYCPPYESNSTYVPCSSCNLKQLNYKYNIIRNIGIIEHHHHKILLKEKYDKINNEININDLIKFIGESNIIITNTYHALYFSALLNKKCILYKPFSEKFNHINFNYVTHKSNHDIQESCREIYKDQYKNSGLLQYNININNNFYNEIISKLSK